MEAVRQVPDERRGPVREERIVAGEQLVAAVAGQRDLHVLAREPREEERREKRRIGERFVELGDGCRQEVDAIRAGKFLRRVFGAESLGSELRPRRLVEALFGKPDGKRPQRLLVPRRQRGDGRRIDSAGEKDAHRHVGDEPLGDGAIEQFQELPGGIGRRAGVRRRQLPVAPQPEAALVENGHVRSRQFANRFVNR